MSLRGRAFLPMWFGLTEGFEREFDQWRTIEHMRSGSVFQAFFGVRVTCTRRLIGRFSSSTRAESRQDNSPKGASRHTGFRPSVKDVTSGR